MTDSFWTKVLWSRFIKHFRKLTDEQIIKDIHESMDALEDNDASGDSFGAKMVAWANERRNEKAAVASRENGNLGGRPRKNENSGSAKPNATEDAATREGAVNMTRTSNCASLESGTSSVAKFNSGSAKPSTDGDTRKDSLELTHAGNSVRSESGTSVENSYAQALDSLPDKASDQGEDNTANIVPGDDGPEPGNLSGDALDGDTSDGDSTLSTEGLADRTTVSKNMRRVPQNEAPAHGFSGGRTAQGTMSRSPEAAAQSGKAYDQGTIEISTDDQKRTGGHSPLSQSPSSRPPVRHVDVTVQGKKPYGANLAVMLTDDEGRKLREIYGENLEMAIDILDSYIANGGKSARKYRSHFSVMRRGNWVWNKVNETLIAERRLSNEEKPRQRYMTADDISRRNAEEGWRQLQLMKGANEA